MKALLKKYAAIFCSSLLSVFMFLSCTLMPAKEGGPGVSRERISFREIWGYVLEGEEASYTGAEPLTDIGYFCATIGPKGDLKLSRLAKELKNGFRSPRVHLVVAVISNPGLLHFCLGPGFGVRERLVAQIEAASGRFDGVQIDFESVLAEDAGSYLDFLKMLKERLGEKRLSVAVPPRRSYAGDAYDYAAVAGIADRVIVMAYDQHWRTSAPGPVASLEWCNEVSSYALEKIPPERLVMGLPLYGRSWQDREHSRALRYPQVREMLEKKRRARRTNDGAPGFSFEDRVSVRVYYDDVDSLHEKLSLYRVKGIGAVSFWRMGQESRELWDTLAHE